MHRNKLASVATVFGLVVSTLLSVGANAAPVSEAVARQVARNYITTHIALHGGWNGVLDAQIESVQLVMHKGEAVAYNVLVQPSGHLLVAYDDDFSPVLLYSDRSTFDPSLVGEPESVAAWILPETHAVYQELRKRAQEFASPALLALAKSNTPSGRAWAHYNRAPEMFVPLGLASEAKAGQSPGAETLAKAGPILSTAWNQGDSTRPPFTYNLYTPGDTGCTHAPVGCVATAAAQLMKYWNWPDSGTGSHSYSWRMANGTTRTLSASFAHTYNWSSMPATLTSTSTAAQVDAVARLMSDLGIANDMAYTCGGSGSNTQNMATVVLPTYFKYRNTVQAVPRSSYTAAQFFDLLKAEFDAVPPRPVLFRMASDAGGHAVVADGYQTSTTNMVHINMGWGGGYTSYYDISNNWTTGNHTWKYDTQVAFTHIQPDQATSCTYALSGSTLSAGSVGGSGSVTLSTSSACTWTATSSASWITITSGASGTGSGSVGFSIAANTATASRSGTLTIGGKTFTVNQAGSACTYAISPTSQSLGGGAASGNINVTAGSSCAWTAYSNANWISISSGASGSGNGTVVYVATTNTSASPRTGTVVVAGQAFTVTQAGYSCSYSVTPSSLSVGSGATAGRLNVIALSGCAWTAASNASWLTVTSGASGSGEGSVSYSVAANSGTASRSASITVGGQVFTLTQAGQVAGAVELLNGDFENGRSGWVENSDYYLIYEDFLAAHGGSWYSWLSGYNNAKDLLYQAVVVPANAQQVTLQFWYGITTAELPSGAYDKMTVGVYNSATGALLGQLAAYSNLDSHPNWRQSAVFDLSAYRGQSIYIAFYATSDDSLNTNFFVDDVKLTVATNAGATSANYTSLWWNPAESGWGLNLNHQGNTIFATLFTYAGDTYPLWLVASNLALQPNGSYTGTLYRTTGPTYYTNPWNPAQVGVSTVGTMTLTFTGPEAGTLTYTFNGVTVTKAIQKQIFSSPVPTCTQETGSRASLTNYQDLWWNPSESGWGVNLTHQGNIIFATLFTYDNAKRDVWLVASSLVRQADGSYTGKLYYLTGPAFNSTPWQSVALTEAGTMTLRFTSGEAGTLSYTVLGTTVTKSIVRQVFGSTVPFCR